MLRAVSNTNEGKIFFQSSAPIGLAPDGTVGAGGALTITSLGLTYSGGIWLYFPAGAVYTETGGSPAGVYWVVMTSATSGSIKNLTLGAAWPYIPASAPSFVATTGAAYDGVITTFVNVASTTLPANAVGPGGVVMTRLFNSYNSSTSSRSSVILFGSTAFFTVSQVTSGVTQERRTNLVVSRGMALQLMSPGTATTVGGDGQANSALIQTTVNMAVDQTVNLQLQRAVKTDVVICEFVQMIVYPN